MAPRTARRLLDFPDLEQVEDLANSQEDYIHEVLEKIVDEGEYTAPEPYDDLQLARELALEYYSQGKQNGLEEEKLQLIRNFLEQVTALEQAAMPPAPPMPPPGSEAIPQGAPMPQPVSDMVPNVPQPMQ